MEKRLVLSICLLLALLAAGICISHAMETGNRALSEATAQAAELAMNGQTEQAVSMAAEAKEQWHRARSFTAAVADHAPMDEVDNLFQEAEIYGRAGEMPHFAACCAYLSAALRAMYEAHSFQWWNII